MKTQSIYDRIEKTLNWLSMAGIIFTAAFLFWQVARAIITGIY